MLIGQALVTDRFVFEPTREIDRPGRGCVLMPGNHGSRGLESVLHGLQRLKSRGMGFLLEKWEDAGCPSASTTAAGSEVGMGLGICTCIKPPGDPTVDEARGPPRTVPSRSCGQPAHSSAVCGFSTLPRNFPWLLSSTRSRPALPVCPVSRCGAQPSAPLCTASARPRLPSTHGHGLLPAPGLTVHTGPLEPDDMGPSHHWDFRQMVFLVFASVSLVY